MSDDLFAYGQRAKEGLALGHKSAEKAADHAGDDWKERAAAAFRAYAATHDKFTTEDVRLANPQIPAPPDNRAWGAIALGAKRAGLIVCGDKVPSRTKHVHGTTVSLWITQ